MDDVHEAKLSENKLSRVFWFSLGMIFTGIGLMGVVIPGLPTTPLMILAAACFAKSSQRFYYWIINNRMFGENVKSYREGNGIPKRSKPVILGTMWAFVLFAVFIAIPDSAPEISRNATVILAVIGTVFILRIPSF